MQSPVVSTQGTYNVTVTNTANGCTAASSVTVTGNTTAPSITTTGGTLDCNTTSVTITATSSANPSTYLWNGPGGFTSNISNPSVGTSGTYNITVTNTSNGCTSTANAVVNLDNAAPNAGASASGNIGCNTPTVTLNGSSTTPSVTYAWTGPGGFTSPIQNPMTGTLGDYIVTVTGANGCTATAPVTVNGSLTVPNASATGGTLTCSATQVQMNGESSTPNVTYSWTGPGGFASTVQDPFVTNPGTYNLVVTNPTNGCTSPASANVDTNLGLPNASATGGIIDCAAGAVTIMGTSSTSGSTVQWSGPGGFTASTNNATVTQQGTYVFTVTGTNGCTNSADAIVTLDAGVPISFATGGELNCTNNSITVTGGTSTLGATFSWTGPGGFMSTANSFLVSQPGDYILTASAANGCTSVATAFVSQDFGRPRRIRARWSSDLHDTKFSNFGINPCQPGNLCLERPERIYICCAKPDRERSGQLCRGNNRFKWLHINRDCHFGRRCEYPSCCWRRWHIDLFGSCRYVARFCEHRRIYLPMDWSEWILHDRTKPCRKCCRYLYT